MYGETFCSLKFLSLLFDVKLFEKKLDVHVYSNSQLKLCGMVVLYRKALGICHRLTNSKGKGINICTWTFLFSMFKNINNMILIQFYELLLETLETAYSCFKYKSFDTSVILI